MGSRQKGYCFSDRGLSAGPDSSASLSEFAGGLVPRQALTLTLPYIIDVAEQMKITI